MKIGPSFGRTMIGLALAAAMLIAADATINNYAFGSASRPDFSSRLDQALERGIGWIDRHADELLREPNSALFYMVGDMAARGPEPRLSRLMSRYRSLPQADFWWRVADRWATARILPRREFDGLQDYQRWVAFAVAPEENQLSEADRRLMFAPDALHSGSLTHQLFALCLYREVQGATPAVASLMRHLGERIATEEYWDFRVTDLYLQRVAFLLASGHPDLVRRRWVERVMENQDPDGGWTGSWHGWGPPPLRFTLQPQSPNGHTTVQGVWLLYLLKYRYPQWAERR